MPDRSGAGRPRKSFTDKQRSGQHIEAADVKAKIKDHQFQAVLTATGLMAKDEGFKDVSFVCRRLAEDPPLAKKAKVAITCPPREGTKSSIKPQPSLTIFPLHDSIQSLFPLLILFIYKSDVILTNFSRMSAE